MSKFMRIKDAERIFPGYKKYPHIKTTESLTVMKITAGWDTKRCRTIGDYYYYLKDHPNADEHFNSVRSSAQTKKGDTQRKVSPVDNK